jgi:hypothetical protein
MAFSYPRTSYNGDIELTNGSMAMGNIDASPLDEHGTRLSDATLEENRVPTWR